MNFLAHLHVVPDRPGLQLGGVLADLVKGPDVAALPADVRAGVVLHRKVDAFTDRHPAVVRSVGRIAAEWGWFSGIVLDIYSDHLLARTWPEWSAEPLRDFADRMYAVLRGGLDLLPPDPRAFLAGVIDSDRLVAYGTVDGITETLARTARRIAARMPTRALPLADAVPQLQSLDAELLADFRAFYSELMRYATASAEM